MNIPPPITSNFPQHSNMPFYAPTPFSLAHPSNFYINHQYNNYYSFTPNYPTFETNISPHPSFQKLLKLPLPKDKDQSNPKKINQKLVKNQIQKSEQSPKIKVFQNYENSSSDFCDDISENRQKLIRYENPRVFFQLKRLSNKKLIKNAFNDIKHIKNQLKSYANKIESTPKTRVKFVQISYNQFIQRNQRWRKMRRKQQLMKNLASNKKRQLKGLLKTLEYQVSLPQIVSKTQLQSIKQLKQSLLSRSLNSL